MNGGRAIADGEGMFDIANICHFGLKVLDARSSRYPFTRDCIRYRLVFATVKTWLRPWDQVGWFILHDK